MEEILRTDELTRRQNNRPMLEKKGREKQTKCIEKFLFSGTACAVPAVPDPSSLIIILICEDNKFFTENVRQSKVT